MFARFFSRRTLFPDRFRYASPAAHGLDVEPVEFWARRGPRLRGQLVRGGQLGVVVFCPGNAGNASSHFEYVRLLIATGYSVLTFDYRGFGQSDGEADLGAIVDDVRAAAEYASYHTGEEVALFGVSLGGPAALLTGGELSVAGVVAEGVADIGWMLRGLFGEGRFGPVRYRRLVDPEGVVSPRASPRLMSTPLPGPIAACLAAVGRALYPFDAKSLPRVASRVAAVPVLLVHGVEDALLPFEAALELHDLLVGPKRLWLIPGVAHAQEPALAVSAEYVAQLKNFLAGVFDGALAAPPAARVLEIHAHQPAPGAVSALLGVDLPSRAQGEQVLLSVSGGSVLAQSVMDHTSKFRVELPGPIEQLVTLRLHHPRPDSRRQRYEQGGYRAVFRAMSRAVSERDLVALEQAVAEQVTLPRDEVFDFVAGLYALRLATELVRKSRRPQLDGESGESWSRRAERALESFLELWLHHPTLPSASFPDSPANWAEQELEALRIAPRCGSRGGGK